MESDSVRLNPEAKRYYKISEMTLKVLFVKPCGKFNDNIHHKGAAFLKKSSFLIF